MKTHFKSVELPHKWAHQLAPVGRCPGHEHFQGTRYFSYGTEIAAIIKRGERKAYLLNVTSYSVTTSSHQNGVRGAIPGGEIVFRIGNIGMGCSLPSGKELGPMLFDYAIKEAADAAEKATRARKEWTKNSLASDQAAWLKQAEQANEFFGLRRKVDASAIERLTARISADNRRKAKQAREAEARREKEAQEQLQAWLAGEPVSFPYGIQRCYLRAVSGRLMTEASDSLGEVRQSCVETSKGVTIPMSDARKAFDFAVRVRSKGWHRNGDQFAVGEYQLDAVNDQGIVAGCHRIDWEILTAFATLQGWI